MKTDEYNRNPSFYENSQKTEGNSNSHYRQTLFDTYKKIPPKEKCCDAGHSTDAIPEGYDEITNKIIRIFDGKLLSDNSGLSISHEPL